MKISENRDNPYLAPEVSLPPEPESRVAGSGYFGIIAGMCLQLLIVVVGLGIANWEIHTIVGSGPIVSVAGLLLAVLSYRKKLLSGVVLGLSAPAFSLLVFLIIFLQGWGPYDAQRPVPVMIGIYLVFVLSTVFFMLMQIRRRQEAAHVDVSTASILLDPDSNSRL